MISTLLMTVIKTSVSVCYKSHRFKTANIKILYAISVHRSTFMPVSGLP